MPRKIKSKVVEEETSGTTLYYEQTAENGDIYITINAARGSKIKVMSGKPPNPPPPPGGG